MFPYEFYRIVHFTGLFLIFLTIGGQIVLSLFPVEQRARAKKFLGINHGIGLFIALLGGFGLLARLGLGMEGWVIGKLTVWLLIGALPAVIYRKPQYSRIIWVLTLVLGITAAYLARYKPF